MKKRDEPENCVPDGEAPDDLLTTGDLARLCSSTLRTVRFYEEEGLIQPVERCGGRRLFPKTELQRLQLALDLREGGLSIQEVKDLFELKCNYPTPAEASTAVAQALETQIALMEEKIAKLRRLREELSAMVSVISECRACEGKRFPKRCGDCGVTGDTTAGRAVTVLWTESKKIVD